MAKESGGTRNTARQNVSSGTTQKNNSRIETTQEDNKLKIKELEKQLSKLQSKRDKINDRFNKLSERARIKGTDAIMTKLSSLRVEEMANSSEMRSVMNQIEEIKKSNK